MWDIVSFPVEAWRLMAGVRATLNALVLDPKNKTGHSGGNTATVCNKSEERCGRDSVSIKMASFDLLNGCWWAMLPLSAAMLGRDVGWRPFMKSQQLVFPILVEFDCG